MVKVESIEIWKDIPYYEGIYQASMFGRIRSVDRYGPPLGNITLLSVKEKYYLLLKVMDTYCVICLILG